MSLALMAIDYLHIVFHGTQHRYLGIGLKAGQYTGCVVVVEQLSTEFQVQLSAELVDALADMLRLQLDVLVVVETLAHGQPAFFSCLL